MALRVHAHERRELHKAWVDSAPSALIAQGHFGDQTMLEPTNRPSSGQLVDLRRIDAGVDRPRHQGHAAWLRLIAVFRHQRGADVWLVKRDA